ncbi:MAG TPA: hypothetical protein VF814_21010 [Casimicrobiaceae bacterium]
MTVVLLIIVVALATIAGYLAGARRRPAAVPAPEHEKGSGSISALPPGNAPGPIDMEPGPFSAAEPRADDSFSAEKARLIRSRDAEAALLRALLAADAAALSHLGELGRERERLFRELADAHAETARYRALVIAIETNAPPPILAGVGEPDDLKLIVGVGPVLERMLHSLGVTTFRQIARWTEREIAEFDARLPEFPGRIQRDQWVTQARALHEAKYGQSVTELRARG